ncbi:hypothetical protein H4Q26_010246 [Puccinia striiformis f. sp. tritici PST-130]|nr:hypothetical protein H4Q26_010246 [Puccinia striiformis f. sp. tritici PST-130]
MRETTRVDFKSFTQINSTYQGRFYLYYNPRELERTTELIKAQTDSLRHSIPRFA